jgi:hypothetical protein
MVEAVNDGACSPRMSYRALHAVDLTPSEWSVDLTDEQRKVIAVREAGGQVHSFGVLALQPHVLAIG